MTIQLILIVVALVGAVVYGATNEKIAELGRIVAFAAFLAFCFSLMK